MSVQVDARAREQTDSPGGSPSVNLPVLQLATPPRTLSRNCIEVVKAIIARKARLFRAVVVGETIRES